MRFRRLSALIRATANKDCKKLNGALLKKSSSHCASSSNASVQLQALYNHCGEAASEKCLSSATFVSPRRVTALRPSRQYQLKTRSRGTDEEATSASALGRACTR